MWSVAQLRDHLGIEKYEVSILKIALLRLEVA
jgi:hypothetical protein